MASSSSEWLCDTDSLLGEWLSLHPDVLKPDKIDVIGSGDGIVIVDMQKDFIPVDPLSNPDGGRFGVAEGDHCTPHIVKLIHAAIKGDATIAATRDYHPADHVSFINEGGPFPEHCVQGTAGAEFIPPIQAALSAAHQARPDRVQVCFKAFHEDSDSFGGFPYANGGDERITRRSPGSESKSYCVGCSACPWTGAVCLKQSAIASAARRGVPPNMDAPPDLLAAADSDHPNDRGRITLEQRLKGSKRLFVCGLALDFCVLDTCLNARLAGFENVILLLDAARAAHIPGVGGHGTGFLSDPVAVVKQLRDAGVRIATSRDACPPQAYAAYGMPPSTAAPAGATSGRSSLGDGMEEGAPSAASLVFPHKLGPLNLETTTSLQIKVPAKEDRYTVALTGSLEGLAGLNFANSGTCSPLAALPKGWPAAPAGAVGLRWAYPADGMSNAESQAFYTLFLDLARGVEKCFVAYGGFLLLDKSGSVVAVQVRTS